MEQTQAGKPGRLGQHPSRWYVGFFDAELPWYLRIFTRPKFRHCVVFTYDPVRDVWIFGEFTRRRFFMEAYRGAEIDGLFTNLRLNGVLVKIDVTTKESGWKPMLPVYCVSYAARLVGLRKTVITPYQLFCALLDAGAEVIFDGQKETGP